MDFRKLGMEALGAFILVLTASTASGAMGPIAIGLSLAIMVYIGGNISGGHYNPAVSFAVCLRGKLPKGDLIPYIIAQVAGGLAAALIAFLITHDAPHIEVAGGAGTLPRQWGFIHGAALSEFIYTFLLAFTVLTVATTKKHANNQYYGLCIGGVVIVAANAVGGISGGAFNPAVGLSKSLVGLVSGNGAKAGAIQWFWVYLVFPMLGGWVAAIAFKFFHPDEMEATVAPAAPAPPQEKPAVTTTPPQV